MLIGYEHGVAVGPLYVHRVTDVIWHVETPDGDFAVVTDDPLEPGWLGEGWAVDAVAAVERPVTHAGAA